MVVSDVFFNKLMSSLRSKALNDELGQHPLDISGSDASEDDFQFSVSQLKELVGFISTNDECQFNLYLGKTPLDTQELCILAHASKGLSKVCVAYPLNDYLSKNFSLNFPKTILEAIHSTKDPFLVPVADTAVSLASSAYDKTSDSGSAIGTIDKEPAIVQLWQVIEQFKLVVEKNKALRETMVDLAKSTVSFIEKKASFAIFIREIYGESEANRIFPNGSLSNESISSDTLNFFISELTQQISHDIENYNNWVKTFDTVHMMLVRADSVSDISKASQQIDKLALIFSDFITFHKNNIGITHDISVTRWEVDLLEGILLKLKKATSGSFSICHQFFSATHLTAKVSSSATIGLLCNFNRPLFINVIQLLCDKIIQDSEKKQLLDTINSVINCMDIFLEWYKDIFDKLTDSKDGFNQCKTLLRLFGPAYLELLKMIHFFPSVGILDNYFLKKEQVAFDEKKFIDSLGFVCNIQGFDYLKVFQILEKLNSLPGIEAHHDYPNVFLQDYVRIVMGENFSGAKARASSPSKTGFFDPKLTGLSKEGAGFSPK